MIGSPPAAHFNRDHSCTEPDWLRCLPGAVGQHPLQLGLPGTATVGIGAGRLHLAWQVLPPRRIGLAQFPRLLVDYRFDGVDDAERASFMRYFDLYIQRGGG